MIACFLSNISAKYYKNPSMLSRVIAKNVGDVFFETQCRYPFNTKMGLKCNQRAINIKYTNICIYVYIAQNVDGVYIHVR